MIFRLISPRPAGRGKVAQQLRELRDAVRELTPSPSQGTKLRRTTMGTLREADSGNKKGTSDGFVPRWG